MAARLIGAKDLNNRLAAIGETFKTYGRTWGRAARDDARRRARPHRRTGRLDRSFRYRASNRRAAVMARYTANFLNAGAKPHTIVPKRPGGMLIFNAGGRTIFAKRVNHRGHRGTHFARLAANDALRDNPMSDELIRHWNGAA